MPKISLNLPTSFYREEVRNDYKISADMKKVWAVELDLFNQLDQICKKHNITYYADSGTLLGAVRHHGFVPWDDDMDFIMLRSDFEKLCKVSSEFKEPYFFQTEETDPGSLRCHAQLRNSETTGIIQSEQGVKYKFNQGIFIDIFPLDNVPDDKEKRINLVKRLQHLKGKARFYYDCHYGFKRNVKNPNLSLFGHIKATLKKPIKKVYYKIMWNKYGEVNPYYIEFKNEVTAYNKEDTRQVMNLAIGLENNSPILKQDLGKPSYISFEMLKMPIPKNYDRILKRYYGEWHKLVKGETVHGRCIFDTEKSYRYYVK